MIKYLTMLIFVPALQLFADKITYISVEHPAIVYTNPKYLSYANITSKRYNRRNPIYYVDLNIEALVGLNNHIKLDFYFYEFLTNQYKPSFVEMHFRLCALINKDPFFGTAMKRAMSNKPCPYPPGVYNMANMTVPPRAIPPGFPFTKGRIYCNITYTPNKDNIASGYIDMEIRQLTLKNSANNYKF